jgi:hypothetical protein
MNHLTDQHPKVYSPFHTLYMKKDILLLMVNPGLNNGAIT